MKKLFCANCEDKMNGILTLGTTSGYPLEQHQCENEDCSEFGKVKTYEIQKNRAIEQFVHKLESFPESIEKVYNEIINKK